MTVVLALFDLLLTLTLLGLAVVTVTSREPRRAVILFIAFGLLLALVWARLRAPDLALAEAAIGAGLSGALMLTAARRASGRKTSSAETGKPEDAT
ncbi:MULTISPECIES: Na(+)/H(+) antiporter subunit B [unclassified Thiocapsa]|uniref:Na(+)/H(+) antiporter subunit B n=1 Tax=unclassified Thiocapsa TaxID=2641286 RepID=UPI0035B2B880